MTLKYQLDPRARRLVAGVLSSLFGRAATLIAPLVATPAMLNYLGDEDFGLWATAVSITTIAVIADLGIGNGLLTRVAAAHGRNDDLAIRRYVSSALAALLLTATTLLLITCLGLWAIGSPKITLIVLAVFIVGIPGAAIYQVLYAVQRVPTANWMQIVGALCAVVATLAAIHVELPSWGVVLAYALPPVVITYGGGALYFFSVPSQRPSLGAIDSLTARDLLSLGSQFFLLAILTATAPNIDNILIASLIGVDAVPGYAIPMRLGSLLSLLIAALYMPMWGANGEAIGKGDFRWVRKSARRMSMLGTAVVAVTGGAIVLGSDMIIYAWVGRAFDGQRLVLIGFLLYSIAIAITSPYNMILNAMGRVNVQIFPWLLFTVTTIAVKFMIISEDTWVLAFVTGIGYAFIILPTILFFALRALKQSEAS